ncbi:MAG: YdiU family protein [Arcobacteraceae bacterium]|nr:YdiU family protein [Arcobacteraceae bacterium]
MNDLKLEYPYKKLSQVFYNDEKPIPLKNPKLISKNGEYLEEIGLDLSDEDLTKLLNGQLEIQNFTPYAGAYSGHQFGYFVPNLGDGRALNLGTLDGIHLQTKGLGVTKYSRNADGRAVLRSSIREYLMSEAMHGLGIPTTRAAAIIDSDTTVYREKTEKTAVVLRTSSSWVRFGTFEFARLQHKPELLKELADFVIVESYPHLINITNRYEELFFAIVDKNITLMALWQSVGFMHGVMNTDNMNIAGLTIDYGPFAFMEAFQKEYICNHSDHEGRYSFSNQPFIARWNLLVLAHSFKEIANHELLESYANRFIGRFKEEYFTIMGKKLGFEKTTFEDRELILELFDVLEICKIDYTVFFYYLSCQNYDGILMMAENFETIKIWLDDYLKRIEREKVSQEERITQMRQINPKYVLKNYMLQDVIEEAENGNYELLNDMLEIAKNPFGEHLKYEKYSKQTPKNLGGFICSCSS